MNDPTPDRVDLPGGWLAQLVTALLAVLLSPVTLLLGLVAELLDILEPVIGAA